MHRHALIVLLAVGLALSSAACLGSIRMESTLPAELGDLTAAKAVEVVDSSGHVLLGGTFAEPSGETSKADKIERTAALIRPADKTRAGTVEIGIDRTSGVSEEEIVVKAEDLPYPATCRVVVDGREIAQFSTLEDGKLNLRVWRRVAAGSGH
jgi:hypothetical protein